MQSPRATTALDFGLLSPPELEFLEIVDQKTTRWRRDLRQWTRA